MATVMLSDNLVKQPKPFPAKADCLQTHSRGWICVISFTEVLNRWKKLEKQQKHITN